MTDDCYVCTPVECLRISGQCSLCFNNLINLCSVSFAVFFFLEDISLVRATLIIRVEIKCMYVRMYICTSTAVDKTVNKLCFSVSNIVVKARIPLD